MIKIFLATLCVALGACENKSTNPKTEPDKELPLELLWSYDTNYSVAPDSEPLEDGEFVYVTGGLGLHKVSKDGGSRIWYSPTEGTASSLLNFRFQHTEKYIFGLHSNKIVAWDKISGAVVNIASVPIEFDLFFFTFGSKYEHFIYYGGSKGGIVRVNAETFDVSYRNTFNKFVYETNTFENGDLLVTQSRVDTSGQQKTSYGSLVRYNFEDSSIVWRYDIPNSGIYGYGYPLIKDNVVYAGTTRGAFSAIDGQTGQALWETFSRDLYCRGYIVTEDKIFVNAVNYVVALDKNTGKILWKTEHLGPEETGRLNYKNGYVYWGHYAGIYIFDAETGETVLHQRPEFGGYIWTSSMTEDRYYVQTGRFLLAYKLYGESSKDKK